LLDPPSNFVILSEAKNPCISASLPRALGVHPPCIRSKLSNSYRFNNLQPFFRDLLENPPCQGVRASTTAPSPRETTTYPQKITGISTLFNLLSLK
jgi:hypothetical protein